MTIQLYDYTTIQLYNYTTIQLYNYTTIHLYDPVFLPKSLEIFKLNTLYTIHYTL